MKSLFITLILLCVLTSCEKHEKAQRSTFNSLKIERILVDSTINIRALETRKSSVLLATADGYSVFAPYGFPKDWSELNVIEPDRSTLADSIKINFRSVAFANGNIFSLSVASPALLFKGKKLVYRENHEKAFYDSMEFWNDEEGIAIGDPTDDCMSIIITRDSGETWTKLTCDMLPKAKDGEAAFAASDSNIAIVGDKTWIATGGKASRVLYSSDKGHTWEVFETPIVQGLETTGMYSIDFYDELNGFAIGGDYTKPADSSANKIRTKDGGETWQLVAENQSPGYRSCVQYVPNGEGKELVVIGFKGIDYSKDAGETWTHFSDEGFYTLRFVNDSVAIAAGSKRISRLIFQK